MTVASLLLMGLTAGYAALSRAAARLAAAQSDMALEAATPICRPDPSTPSSSASARPIRCTLPEICAYDVVSRKCRTTA